MTVKKFFKRATLVIIVAIFATLFGVVEYATPHYRVAYVTGVEVKRADPSKKANTQNLLKDTYFIYTAEADNPNDVKVYRNEDTLWSFPFYFKFNSADVAGAATNLANAGQGEHRQLAQIKYYGWRIKILSQFPNIISIKTLDKADDVARPILAYVLYVLLLIGLFFSIQFVRGWFDSKK